MQRLTWFILIMTAFIFPTVSAQLPPPSPSKGDLLFDQYLRLETAKLSDRVLDGVTTKEEWEKRRAQLKEQYLDMLGLWPLPERTPLNAKVTGTLERDDIRVEKLHFQSKPGLYVTANLFLPKKIEGKLPAVVYVCGHSDMKRDGNKTGYHHHGTWFATHGYACLVLDTLQLGEIAGIHHGTYREGRWWWQAMGYTPAGVECWNGVRAIDYLETRPEIDADKIAVTGRSGGGAATFWIAAADDRVKVAVPVSGMSDLETYVSDKVINGHCDCMFLYNTYRWEWTTIAALVAPRPMLFLNSGHDGIFPMPGNERIRDRLEALYKLYTNKPESLFDVGVTPGGHKDNQELRLMAYRWINHHLKKDDGEVREGPIQKFEPKELRVFPEDKDIPTDALNRRIDESFVVRQTLPTPSTKEQFVAWRQQLMDRLHTRVFREWPEQMPAAELMKKEDDDRVLLSTEPGMLVTARELRYDARPAAKRRNIIVLNVDEPDDKIPDWAETEKRPTDMTMLLNPRGCGGLGWTKKSPPNTVERSHVLLGRTVDTGRVRDVQAAVRWLHDHDEHGLPIRVIGRGQAGILAAFAALLEPSIEEVVVVDPPVSHKDGPIFLNVMRYMDIPDALGMLAPRSLTLVNAREKSFANVLDIYKAAGAPDKVKMAAGAESPSSNDKLQSLRREVDDADAAYMKRITDRAPREEVDKAWQAYLDTANSKLPQIVGLIRRDPKSPTAFDALQWMVVSVRQTAYRDWGMEGLQLLCDHHAENPGIGKICETMAAGYYWDGTHQPVRDFLRTAMDKNPNRTVRGLAAFALAVLLHERSQALTFRKKPDAGMVLQEAEKLFEKIISDHAEITLGKSARTLGERAKTELNEIRNLAIGRAAPDIEGEDIDGNKFKLSDYRGKVVVLDFWGHW